jgi:hypothetical protein
MKTKKNLLLLTLSIIVTLGVFSIIPNIYAGWTTLATYEVKNQDDFQSAKFTAPETAEKIRLTFDITAQYPSGGYALVGSLLDEYNVKKDFQETSGLSHTFEFEGLAGDINLSVLLTLASAELTVEWYGVLPDIQVIVIDSEGDSILGATISSTSQPTGQNSLSGVTPTSGSVTFNEVESGRYTFNVDAEGYESNSGSISTSLSETATVTLQLESEPEPEPEVSQPSGGIPSFPILSIIIGITLVMIRKSKSSSFLPTFFK